MPKPTHDQRRKIACSSSSSNNIHRSDTKLSRELHTARQKRERLISFPDISNPTFDPDIFPKNLFYRSWEKSNNDNNNKVGHLPCSLRARMKHAKLISASTSTTNCPPKSSYPVCCLFFGHMVGWREELLGEGTKNRS